MAELRRACSENEGLPQPLIVHLGTVEDGDRFLGDAWPEVQSNERGLSRFVYGFMVDRLRRVSEHVTIGSAARKGKEMGSYFVLTRDDG